MRPPRFILCGLLLALALPCQASEVLQVAHFSQPPQAEELPSSWQPLLFDGIEQQSSYRHVMTDEGGAVLAQSQASASGLIRKVDIDPQQLPLVSWQWKVKEVVPGSTSASKEGDDYAARLYITFAYDPDKVSWWEWVKFNAIKVFYGEYPPIAAINYVWASTEPVGHSAPNPYTDRVQMIVVNSGNDLAGQWQQLQRNIVSDYRQAFGSEPSTISGVGIMTDTDNTKGQATAWYGDIVFEKE